MSHRNTAGSVVCGPALGIMLLIASWGEQVWAQSSRDPADRRGSASASPGGFSGGSYFSRGATVVDAPRYADESNGRQQPGYPPTRPQIGCREFRPHGDRLYRPDALNSNPPRPPMRIPGRVSKTPPAYLPAYNITSVYYLQGDDSYYLQTDSGVFGPYVLPPAKCRLRRCSAHKRCCDSWAWRRGRRRTDGRTTSDCRSTAAAAAGSAGRNAAAGGAGRRATGGRAVSAGRAVECGAGTKAQRPPLHGRRPRSGLEANRAGRRTVRPAAVCQGARSLPRRGCGRRRSGRGLLPSGSGRSGPGPARAGRGRDSPRLAVRPGLGQFRFPPRSAIWR